MIPILNILPAFVCILCLLVAFKLRAKVAVHSDGTVKRFMWVFFSFALLFALHSVPGVLVSNAIIIQIVFILATLVAYIAIINLLLIAMHLLQPSFSNKLVLSIMSSITIISIVFEIIFFEPAEYRSLGGRFYYYAEGIPEWLQALVGVILSIGVALTAFMFFRAAITLRDRWLRRRSILIGGGMTFFTIAAIAYFILRPLLLDAPLPVAFVMAAMGVVGSGVGITLILLGINMRSLEKEMPNKTIGS